MSKPGQRFGQLAGRSRWRILGPTYAQNAAGIQAERAAGKQRPHRSLIRRQQADHQQLAALAVSGGPVRSDGIPARGKLVHQGCMQSRAAPCELLSPLAVGCKDLHRQRTIFQVTTDAIDDVPSRGRRIQIAQIRQPLHRHRLPRERQALQCRRRHGLTLVRDPLGHHQAGLQYDRAHADRTKLVFDVAFCTGSTGEQPVATLRRGD